VRVLRAQRICDAGDGRRSHHAASRRSSAIRWTASVALRGVPLVGQSEGRSGRGDEEMTKRGRPAGVPNRTPPRFALERCACGNQLKLFASSGRVAKSCAECSGHSPKRGPRRVCWLRKCWGCGAEISPRSAFCAPCYKQRTAKAPVTCKGCGTQFVQARKGVKYCTHACASAHDHQWRGVAAQSFFRRTGASGYIRRRMRSGARFEPVNMLQVFERDGWKCKACGCDTPAHLRGTFDDNAPELDHVVPLRDGGEHSYANTQCLCRVCNTLKGHMAFDQFMNQYFVGAGPNLPAFSRLDRGGPHAEVFFVSWGKTQPER
jgi:5-methylcytosine-specific restriction endonuclease McrA